MDRIFATLSHRVANWAGQPSAFVLALVTVILWLVTGPLFHYSDTGQLVINTGTTIVTFLMAFR
jgi:low affinity Fe/Cu permease